MVNSYNRRGISTIVGGIIFLVLLSGGFSAFFVALDVQKDTINTHREISKSVIEITLEKFVISAGTNPVDNTFEIQVENQGVNPVEITNIWIINRSSVEVPPYTAQSIDVDYDDAFVPPGYDTQILENTPLSLSPGLYDIKVVSALGTIVTEKKFDPSGAGGEGEEVIIKDELFAKPDIFMIFPNPAGLTLDVVSRGLWGVMIANPTEQPMKISKLVIIATSPRASSSDKIFKDVCDAAPYDPVAITPFTATAEWSCPRSNQLVWTNPGVPVIVQPRSVHPFLVEIGVNIVDTGDDETGNFLINTVVFSDLGQFGKAGYISTMQQKAIAMPNVFLSKVDDKATAANAGNILGNITKITEGTTVTFNATLVDMSDNAVHSFGIKAGTKLIINIPKDWTYNNDASSTDFTIQLPVQTYPDGSTQIVGVLDSPIDEPNDAGIIKFSATAPAVSGAKIYIMHILADGIVTSENGDFTIGPLAEEVLQVCPITGCP